MEVIEEQRAGGGGKDNGNTIVCHDVREECPRLFHQQSMTGMLVQNRAEGIVCGNCFTSFPA